MTRHSGEDSLGHAGNEKKVNVAYTRARDFLFVVGDSRVLDSPCVGAKNGRDEFIFESLNGVLARKAITQRYSEKAPESELAGQLEKLVITANETNGIRAHEVDREGVGYCGWIEETK